MTIPYPMQYINHALYHYGHLNDEQIVYGCSQSELKDEAASTASELVKKREHLTLDSMTKQVSKKTEGDKSDHPKDNATRMEVEKSIQKLLQGETVPPNEEKSMATGGTTTPTSAHDGDSDVEMKEVNIDILNISSKGEDDQHHCEDLDKYTGTTKFNPKSFKAGQGQGTISMTKS